MLKKCAEKLSSKFKYSVETNKKKQTFYFVYGTAAQMSGNGGRGGDNGRGGSAGQIFTLKLNGESSKCKNFYKNGNYYSYSLIDK